jgi:hypothetical protein
MRLPLLTLSMIGAGLFAAASARAADIVPLQPPAAYVPPPVAAVPPPVVVERAPVIVERVAPAAPPPCWRYGARGWGWYPCVAGPPPYWHGYHYGYRWRPYWAGAHRWHRSYW